jgi:hypothetical protein
MEGEVVAGMYLVALFKGFEGCEFWERVMCILSESLIELLAIGIGGIFDYL